MNRADADAKLRGWRRFFRRGPWENAATVLIAAGVVMLMQPYFMVLYTFSFVVILTGRWASSS